MFSIGDFKSLANTPLTFEDIQSSLLWSKDSIFLVNFDLLKEVVGGVVSLIFLW